MQDNKKSGPEAPGTLVKDSKDLTGLATLDLPDLRTPPGQAADYG